jgi:hypothetical protein
LSPWAWLLAGRRTAGPRIADSGIGGAAFEAIGTDIPIAVVWGTVAPEHAWAGAVLGGSGSAALESAGGFVVVVLSAGWTLRDGRLACLERSGGRDGDQGGAGSKDRKNGIVMHFERFLLSNGSDENIAKMIGVDQMIWLLTMDIERKTRKVKKKDK